jgi:hypothetical protein
MPVTNSVNEYAHGTIGGLKKYFGTLSSRTLAQRVSDIGATNATLEVTAQETISASLEIPANITVIMKPGSVLTLSGDGTIVNFEGPVICQGVDHFSAGAGTEFIFNQRFDAPRDRMFVDLNGMYSFGRHKTELISQTVNNWTGTNWSWNSGVLTHTPGDTTSATHSGTVTAYAWYDVRYDKDTTAAGGVAAHVGSVGDYGSTVDCRMRSVLRPKNTAGLSFSTASAFAGTISNISLRLLKTSKVHVFYPEWWSTTGGVAVKLDASVDTSTAINRALMACYYAGGGTVYLAPGIWSISSRIHHPVVNTLLKGSGMGTKLYVDGNNWPGSNMGLSGGKYGYAMIGLLNPYQDNQTMEIIQDMTLSSEHYYADGLTHIWINNNCNALGFRRLQFYGNIDTPYDRCGIECPISDYSIVAGTEFVTGTATKHHMVGEELSFTSKFVSKTGKGCIYAPQTGAIERWHFRQMSFAVGSYYTAINFGGKFSRFADIYFNNPGSGGNTELMDNNTGGQWPRILFNQVNGHNELGNIYYEGDNTVYVMWTGAASGRVTTPGVIHTGMMTISPNNTKFINWTKTPAISPTKTITRVDGNTLTISGNCITGAGLAWYLNDYPYTDSKYDVGGGRSADFKSYIWCQTTASGWFRVAIDYTGNTNYNEGSDLTTIKTIDTLPGSGSGDIIAVNREVVIGDMRGQALEANYIGNGLANRLRIGYDWYSPDYVKCLRHYSFKPYTTSHTISSGASEAVPVTLTVSPPMASLTAQVIVSLPRNAAAGIVCHGQINTAGDTITLNITNMTGSQIDLNGMTFEISIIGY